MDHHVLSAVTAGLRHRTVDVLIAFDDGYAEAEDEAILERATAMGRVLFTYDADFLAIASQWQRASRPFAGVIFARPRELTIGQTIEWLELIVETSTPPELANTVQFVPLR